MPCPVRAKGVFFANRSFGVLLCPLLRFVSAFRSRHYTEELCFLVSETARKLLFFCRLKGHLKPRNTDQSASCSARSCPAPPSRRCPPCPDLRVVCSGFGVHRWYCKCCCPSIMHHVHAMLHHLRKVVCIHKTSSEVRSSCFLHSFLFLFSCSLQSCLRFLELFDLN